MRTPLLTAALFLAIQFSAQAASTLSGDYRVIDSAGCSEGLGLTADMPVSILATPGKLDLRARTDVTDSSFSIPTGHSEEKECDSTKGFCFGIIRRFLDATLSADGRKFNAVQTLVDNGGYDKTPRVTGELTLTARGNQTEITSTLSSQFEPAPLSTCVLERVVH